MATHERMCKDKRMHGDRKAAKQVAKKMRMVAKNQGDPFAKAITAYRCPHCLAWHIGHDPRLVHDIRSKW